MKPFKRIALALALAPALSSPAFGLGLGDVKLMSYLNEPLRAEVVLLDVKDLNIEDIRVRLATQEDFDRLGVERAYFLSSIQFQIVVDGTSSKILMTTSEPLLEPYLDFLLETRWPDGRLLREYTVLVDLPKATLVQTTPAPDPAPAQVAPPKNTVTTAPVASKPKRNYDRDVGEQPAPGQRYLVQAQDSLWEIAAAGRPANASVAQTMIATVAMNSDAFQGANINGLKAGYVLEMPGPDDIYTSTAEAVAMVKQHNEDWAAGIMRQPMLRVLADNEIDESSTNDSDAGADVTTLENTPSTVTSGAPEPLVSADDALPQSAQSTTAVANNPAEDRTQTTTAGGTASSGMNSVELAAIQRRLSELSDQVGDLRQLVTVKDRQIAALQAELAARDIATAAAMVPAQQDQPSTAVRPATTGLPWWVYALGGVVVLAFAGVYIARRADRRYLATAGDSHSLGRTSRALARADAARREMRADPQLIGQSLDEPAVEVGSISDAIAEADIYIAYGRYQQAIELLTSAAQTEPDNPIVYLKLVNTYLKTDRWHDAQALLTTLEGCGDPVVLDQAVALIEAHTPAVDDDLGLLASEPDTAPVARSSHESTTAASPPSREPLTTAREALDPIEFEPVTPVQAPVASNDSVTKTVAAVDTFDSEPDPEPSTPSVSALDDFDLELELDTPFDRVDDTDVASTASREAQATSDSGMASEWEGLSDSVGATDDRLPPELAAVLGTDVPPPFEESSYDEDNTLIYAKDADPVDTKLDLARAYFDMGDEDGARPVLEEIIAEGDLQQQAEARELLLRLD